MFVINLTARSEKRQLVILDAMVLLCHWSVVWHGVHLHILADAVLSTRLCQGPSAKKYRATNITSSSASSNSDKLGKENYG